MTTIDDARLAIRTGGHPRFPCRVVGLVVCAVAANAATPATAEILTRERALEALQHPANPAARRQAVQSLGETGIIADLPWLAAALRDDDQLVRAVAENSLWRVWSRSGDEEIDRLFIEGVAEMQSRQLRRAIETFSRIIEKKPEFAEAWNKRATIHYWLGEFEKSLADCDEVMKRNPYHFGALTGYGMIYIHLDQPERALDYLERALAINPNLRQVRAVVEEIRRLLREGGRERT
jgi:tetratricopeptide (TPR) repeat protein